MVSKCPTCGNSFEPYKFVAIPGSRIPGLIESDRCYDCLRRLDKIDVEDFMVRWKWLFEAVESMVNSQRLFPVEGDNLLFSIMLGEDDDKDNGQGNKS